MIRQECLNLILRFSLAVHATRPGAGLAPNAIQVSLPTSAMHEHEHESSMCEQITHDVTRI